MTSLVAVDQALDAAAQFGHLRLHRRDRWTFGGFGLAVVEPALVFRHQTARIAEQLLDFPPDCRIESVGANLPIGTDTLASKTPGIAAIAAIIVVGVVWTGCDFAPIFRPQ